MNDQTPSWDARTYIAKYIISGSLFFIIVICALVIYQDKTKADGILTSVLPLTGTWVGTVMAYYFSKENFESATKSVTNAAAASASLAQSIGIGKSLKVDAKMIPLESMYYERLPTGIDPSTMKIKKILETLIKSGKGDRIPILNEKNEIRFIVHRSMIERGVTLLLVSGSQKPYDQISIADLLGIQEVNKYITTLSFVSKEATIADAKSLIDHTKECQDVFITSNGASGPVLGWLTNTLILTLSNA